MITLEQALRLPQADYATMKHCDLSATDMMSADIGAAVITNRTSAHPVICTKAPLKECLAFALENTRTGVLAIAHVPDWKKHRLEALAALVSQVRDDPAQLLKLHLIGFLHNTPPEQMDYSPEYWHEEMGKVIAEINRIPNLKLCTFDVGTKPHPMTFAFAHLGDKARLIRGTADIASFMQAHALIREKDSTGLSIPSQRFAREHVLEAAQSGSPACDESPFDVTFDGRQPQYQKSQKTVGRNRINAGDEVRRG